MLDVIRNSVCTHAHPAALVGATLHALSLAHAMATGNLPDPAILSKLVDEAAMVPSVLHDDPQLGELWLTVWEREARRSFDDAWQAACQDTSEAVTTAERALASGSPAERYSRVIDVLNLVDPDRRGSGMLTAVAAAALTWCDERPAEALTIAANVIGSDTDTVATMAGALLGALAVGEPPVAVMDSALIAAEAERMAELASGGRRNGHRYPDLLTWTAPKTQADALLRDPETGLHVAGLGPIRRTLGVPMAAPQGAFQWQWAELAFGQTILIKRRDVLPIVHHPDSPGDDTGGSQPHRRGATEMPVAPDTRHPQRRRWGGDRSEPERGSQREGAGHERRARPLELERVIEFVEREQGNDASIGYAVRRVANEASTEQLAAFLAVLLQILRRSPGGG